MNFIFDLLQQREIGEARKDASRAIEQNRESQDSIFSLRRKIDTLALANQALYEILADHLGVTEAQVLQKMKEIDRRDGRTNGVMDAMPVICRKCGRSANSSLKKCPNCGEGITEGHLFQKL